MSSQSKEIIMDTDRRALQHFTPDIYQQFFYWRARRYKVFVGLSPNGIWRGEDTTVNFSMWSAWQLLQDHKARWNHVVRQFLPRILEQLLVEILGTFSTQWIIGIGLPGLKRVHFFWSEKHRTISPELHSCAFQHDDHVTAGILRKGPAHADFIRYILAECSYILRIKTSFIRGLG